MPGVRERSQRPVGNMYPLWLSAEKESKEAEKPSTEEKVNSPTEEKVEETDSKEQEKFEKMVMFLAEQTANPQPMMTEAVSFFEKSSRTFS